MTYKQDKKAGANRKIWGKRSLASVIDNVTKEYRKEHGDILYNLIKLWPKIIGDRLSRISMPVKLQFSKGNTNGTLIIEVMSPAFSLEVQAMEHIIVQKVAVFFGYQSIARIRVQASNNRKRFAYLENDLAEPLERQKLMPEETDLMIATIEEIEDDELRQILSSLQQSYFE
jgi:hypothetical protein